MTPVVLQEVLQGARSMEQFESWAARFGSIPMLSPPDLASTLREAARVLRPGGALGVVEWKKIHQLEGPPYRHRLSPAKAVAFLTKLGRS